MISFLVKCILALLSLLYTINLFAHGSWGWAIVMIFVTAFIGIFFFRHERVILAFYHMRSGNQEKARINFNKITFLRVLPKRQRAFVIYMQAVLNSQQTSFSKTEQALRKALSIGLRAKHDKALARMHLAGVCAQTGRVPEAVKLLAEAKKIDTSGMLKDQINSLQSQLKRAPSANQLRMAQMAGGRKKVVRNR